jgi:protein O-mannosyl-transferase
VASRPRKSAQSLASPAGFFDHPWRLYGLLCALVLVVYLNSFGLDLTTDAYVIVHNDSRVREFSLQNFHLLFARDYWWPQPADTLYRPITLLSYLINFAILGDGERAGGYHAVNVLLHGINTCLLFALAARLLRNREIAFFAAALWAIHPIGTESVTNVAGRADLLAGFAVFAGLLLHAASAEWTGGRRWLSLLGIFALTLFGGLSKENALVLPALLLLWDTLDGKQFLSRLRLRVLPYLSSAAAIGVVLLVRQQIMNARAWPKPPFAGNPLVITDFWTARLTAVKVLGNALWLLLFPAQLAFDRSYNHFPFSSWGDPAVWLSLAAPGALIGIALVRYRRDPVIYFAAGFAAIAMLTTSNLLVLIGSIFAERFLYLPAAGFAIAVAALLYRLPDRQTTHRVLAALLVLYAGRTFYRNLDWKDNVTLEMADVNTVPRNYRIHDLLARALFVRDTAANIDRSIQEGEAAWNILRTLPGGQIPDETPYHLGLYYGTKGERMGGSSTPEGRDWYAKGIAILERTREISLANEAAFDRLQAEHGRPLPGRTAYQQIFKSLGLLYSRTDRHQEALATLRTGRAVNPDTAEFYLHMAREYQALKDAQMTAVMVLENAEVEGMTVNVLNALREAAGPLPQAACAISQTGAGQTLNYGCAWLRASTCTALGDLSEAYTVARQPARASQLRDKAVRQFGCPAR